MAGKIKKTIDQIIQKRAGNNPLLINAIKTKLQLKGINITQYNLFSPDEEAVIEKLRKISAELNITIEV